MSPRARLLIASALFVLVTGGLEIGFRHLAHAELFWHRLPAFDFFYGFAGCGVIVLASKWLGKRFLQRDEDYYS